MAFSFYLVIARYLRNALGRVNQNTTKNSSLLLGLVSFFDSQNRVWIIPFHCKDGTTTRIIKMTSSATVFILKETRWGFLARHGLEWEV